MYKVITLQSRVKTYHMVIPLIFFVATLSSGQNLQYNNVTSLRYQSLRYQLNISLSLIGDKKYQEALSLCENIINLPLSEENWPEIADSYEYKSRIYSDQTDFNKAKQSLLDKVERFKDQYQINQSYYNIPIPYVVLPQTYDHMARLCMKNNDFNTAKEYYLKLEEWGPKYAEKMIQTNKLSPLDVKELQYDTNIGNSMEIGDCEYQLSNFTSALNSYLKAEKFFAENSTISNPDRELRNKYLSYKCHFELPKKIAECYMSLNNIPNAENYYRQAKSNLIQYKDDIRKNYRPISDFDKLNDLLDSKLQECSKKMK